MAKHGEREKLQKKEKAFVGISSIVIVDTLFVSGQDGGERQCREAKESDELKLERNLLPKVFFLAKTWSENMDVRFHVL